MFLYQKLKYDYKHLEVSDRVAILCGLQEFIEKAKSEKPDLICFDTETDGLNIIRSRPFLVSAGFNKTVITFDFDTVVLKAFWKLIEQAGFDTNIEYSNYIGLFAHNCKYDWHMMDNGDAKILESIKIYDSITVARLTEYADDRERMGLEFLGAKYVDENSKFAGKVIKEIIKKLDAARKSALQDLMIKEFPEAGFSIKAKNGSIKMTTKYKEIIENYNRYRTPFVNDDDIYYQFIDKHFTPANYRDVYDLEPELMRSYAADDIVIMLEYLKKSIPALLNIDKDLVVLKREGKLIRAVGNMEKVGLKVDVDYVLNCRKKMTRYKSLLYWELELLTDKEFTVGQSKFIKTIFKTKYGIETDKCDEKALEYIKNNAHTHISDQAKLDELISIINNILELRTIDKWLSTYVDGKLKSMINGRIYTEINNSGAVSGRVSCDMQQQPKEALLDREGNELFHPRKMFVCDDDNILVFIDESQMELRVQAYYTILTASAPDLKMCRAYMPYECHTYVDDNKEYFDYNNVDHLKSYLDHKWHLNEDESEWTPTDLHSETTSHAFPKVDPHSAEFKKLRKLGKRANFLKVYQGGVVALMESLDIERGVAEALDKAFYVAFPKIKEYQDWVAKQLQLYGFVENLYGRRFYMNNSKWFYKGCNYLIQGTCADMVKDFEIKIDEYLRKNNLKTKMVLPIHDELVFSVPKGEEYIIKDLQHIMEDVTDVIKNIPMIAEIEYTKTNWKEKEEWK